ncbi:hypothetical protein ACHMW4_16460 [Mesorhizobium sp. UC22_110]|uniref:hypothetical protein n=1 Tax=Mesorhizobium sp. UC22_110 TaxID=3374552 RepID=UPI003757DE3E
MNLSAKSPVSCRPGCREDLVGHATQQHGAAVGKLLFLEPVHLGIPGNARQLFDLGYTVGADEFGDDDFPHSALHRRKRMLERMQQG